MLQRGIRLHTEQDKGNFKRDLDKKLARIDVDVKACECSDVKCKAHANTIGKYCCDILESVLHCQAKHIPVTTPGESKGRKPGWNEYVSEYYNESIYWHTVWVTKGRPGCEMRNHSRREYHKAVKFINSNRDFIKRINFMNASLLSGKNLFREIRKLRGGNKQQSGNIDGCTSNESIAKVFSDKYNKLYITCQRVRQIAMIIQTLHRQLNRDYR